MASVQLSSVQIIQHAVVGCSESNELLKFKFRKLHSTVVNCVNPASIINFLFQEDIIGADDMRSLLRLPTISITIHLSHA